MLEYKKGRLGLRNVPEPRDRGLNKNVQVKWAARQWEVTSIPLHVSMYVCVPCALVLIHCGGRPPRDAWIALAHLQVAKERERETRGLGWSGRSTKSSPSWQPPATQAPAITHFHLAVLGLVGHLARMRACLAACSCLRFVAKIVV